MFFASTGLEALPAVHYQMLCTRRESNKDGSFTLTCFLLLQDTWPWLLCTIKCCAGAESLTKMALSHSLASFFCRKRGSGFCTLSKAAQAQRVQQKCRCQTHMCSISAGHVALASVHYQMLRRRRESAKIALASLYRGFIFLSWTLVAGMTPCLLLKKHGSFTACRVHSDITRITFLSHSDCFDTLKKIILLYYLI
jgi:hypothetical protein